MRFRLILVTSLLIFLFYLSTLRFNCVEVKSSNGHPVHNIDTGLDYATIQEAIDALETLNGHTIFVEEGVYYEHVVVNKTVLLIGENRETTIIDANGTSRVLKVMANEVVIEGFTIQNSGLFEVGLEISGCQYVLIRNNVVTANTGAGIGLYFSFHNTISGNVVTNNGHGISLYHSSNNTISRNDILASMGTCISLSNSSNSNTISENIISNSEWIGIWLSEAFNNTIYHNNVINNINQVYSRNSANIWDDGYPSGGNYWSDYNGTDSNHDGIGDAPYVIDENNQDNYPLMGMFSSFNTSLGYNVDVISNSTIEDFEYFESNNTIIMHVSNTTLDQTFGFVRICIPHALMNNTYQVMINGAEPYYVNYTLYDNGTHRWIYFSYQHSTLEIIIVPEFPSILILPLLMTMTLPATLMWRKKNRGQFHKNL